MIEAVPPALIFITGALVLPLIPGRRLRQAWLLALPLLAGLDLLGMPPGTYWSLRLLHFDLVLGRVDALSMVFAYVFVLISFIAMLYAIHIRDMGQHVAAYLYAGSALGVVFAGDFFSLLVFWEIMAVASTFLIWYRRTKAATEAGMRYILVHLTGGCCLLAGIVLQVQATGSLAFDQLDIHSPGAVLILVGFLVNAAVPPLHAWLADAYPEGTITGSVFMTAYTTKSAVYILARCFPGLEALVWLGAVMTLYGVVYAVMENDIRRLLSYHIVSQVGYMVCGVGLGTAMAINGATAHAFCHILYKALLFMGAGAVLEVTGRRKLTDLQGCRLYRKMPLTLGFYMIGAFSISAVPLFNGFISKPMIVAAAGALDRPTVELMLHLASIGTFLSVGLKLPWKTWFGTAPGAVDTLPNATEPPKNMLLAMGLGSLLCVVTGVFPDALYRLLPYPVDFHPYEPAHVVGTLQLLVMTLAAFWLFIDRLQDIGRQTIFGKTKTV